MDDRGSPCGLVFFLAADDADECGHIVGVQPRMEQAGTGEPIPLRRLIILGDLFHSSHNSAWAPFAAWCAQQSTSIHLVPGNHDVLADRRYAEAGIQLCDESVEEGPFAFTHGGRARHAGRQSIRMHCMARSMLIV
jgi:hypothetical protein